MSGARSGWPLANRVHVPLQKGACSNTREGQGEGCGKQPRAYRSSLVLYNVRYYWYKYARHPKIKTDQKLQLSLPEALPGRQALSGIRTATNAPICAHFRREGP